MSRSPLAAAAFLASLAALQAAAQPAPADAKAFVEAAEERLLKLSVESSHADWVNQTYVMDDTDILSAAASERVISATVELAKQATRFSGAKLTDDVARKLIVFDRPSLPEWLNWLCVRGLTLGDGIVDVQITRGRRLSASIEVLRRDGDVEVLVRN